MRIESTASVAMNSVIFIESLSDIDAKTGKAVFDALVSSSPHAPSLQIRYYAVESAQEVLQIVESLVPHAATGLRPIVQIDAHGLTDHTGLKLREDVLLWKDFANACRQLNHAAENNLIVCVASCYGLGVILESNIELATPFFAAVGSEEREWSSDIQDSFTSFYLTLYKTGSLTDASEELRGDIRTYFAEKALMVAFGKYVKEQCRGAGLTSRVEKLLDEIGRSQDRDGRRAQRKAIRQQLAPSAAEFERFKSRFLLADHPSNVGRFAITFGQVMGLVRSARKRRVRI